MTAPRRRPSLGAVFLTVLIDLLGFGLVVPFLADEARSTFGATAFVGTLLSVAYSLMQFLFVPVWGRLSDRIGRRPVLLVSIGATALSMGGLGVGLGFGHSILWLFAARTLGGIATANLGTASAYVADVTKPEDRAKGMGLIGMAFGLGFILGPVLGGVLAPFTVNGRHGALACFVAAALAVVNLLWASYGLAESLPVERRRDNARTQPSLMPLDLTAAKRALARPGVALAVAQNFLIVVSFANLDQTFRYFNKDLFGMTAKETGLLLAAIGVVGALTQGVLVRPLARRMDETVLVRAGVFLQMAAFAGIAVAPRVGQSFLYAAGSLLAIGNGLSQPSLSALISKRTDASAQGNVLATQQAAGALGRVLGPAFGGFVYGAISERAPYLAGAVGMGAALVFAMMLEPARRSSYAGPHALAVASR